MSNLGSRKLKTFRLGARVPSEGGSAQKAKAMTQSEMGDLIGVTTGMISFLETGHKRPSLKLASRLEKMGICPASDWHKPLPREANDEMPRLAAGRTG